MLAVRYIRQHPEKIPIYEQIVLDEFQDFNLLEVSLIELLATKSPILIAGDDDQALYESLKNASAEHIRERHSVREHGYEAFSLPYCSRCTRVIVEATNDLIEGARKNGHLPKRIDKPFRYFDCPEKDSLSGLHPKLVYAPVFAKQIPWFIEQRIQQIATQERGRFTALVISPTRTQCKGIASALQNKGFENIRFAEKKDDAEAALLEGLKLLLQDSRCNLGWRIVSAALLPPDEFKELLSSTHKSKPSPISDLVSSGVRKDVGRMLKILRALRDDREIEDAEALAVLMNRISIEPNALARQEVQVQLGCGNQPVTNPGIRKIPITVTTIQGSKGLAADYVFISHFDDRYFVKDHDKDNISDQDVCSFLVALTRARKKVFLVSSVKEETPTFLTWIDPSRIETLASPGGP